MLLSRLLTLARLYAEAILRMQNRSRSEAEALAIVMLAHYAVDAKQDMYEVRSTKYDLKDCVLRTGICGADAKPKAKRNL